MKRLNVLISSVLFMTLCLTGCQDPVEQLSGNYSYKISGSVIIATLTLNGPNRQNADYTAQLSGYGAYTVGA